MFIQIITHTPIWVWAIFALLAWLGLKQSRPSAPGLKRITLIPLAMLGLSLFGAVSVFGVASGMLLAWACSAIAVATVVMQQPVPPGTHYNSWTQRFDLPGSWLPGALMMGIFITKYAVGITAVMRPDVLHNAVVSYGVCALYGAFSGVFAGRAWRLCTLAWGQRGRTSRLTGA
jgi:hypothetical protein